MGVPNRGPQMAAATILFVALSWIVVLLRYYVRYFIAKKFLLDDLLTGICVVLFTAYAGIGVAGVHWGAGRHIYDVPPQYLRNAIKVWYICEVTYAVTACLLRLTVGIFLLRLVTSKLHRRIIITLNAANVTAHVIFLAGTVYQCVPISYYWDRFRLDGVATGTCFDANVAVKETIGVTVVAAVTDWTFALLPIWFMWNLQLSKQKKITVCFLLGLGALASAAPLIRLPHLTALLNNSDFLWATVDIAIWSVVELGIGIIVISLPSCRPLLRRIPFFASMSARSTAPTPNQPSDSEKSWSSRQVMQKAQFRKNDVELSAEDHSIHEAETSLSETSAPRDIENALH